MSALDPLEPVAGRRAAYRPRRWSLLVAVGIALVVSISAVTDLVQRASSAGRLSDLRSYYAAEEGGVASCAGGLRDSLVALQAVLSGDSSERGTAESIASLGAQACMPLTDEDLFDMDTSAPPRSLAGYGVATAGDDVYAWAYPGAAAAQTDLLRLLRDHGSSGGAAAQALDRRLVALRRSGQQIERLFDTAAARLHGHLERFRPSIALSPPAVLAPP